MRTFLVFLLTLSSFTALAVSDLELKGRVFDAAWAEFKQINGLSNYTFTTRNEHFLNAVDADMKTDLRVARAKQGDTTCRIVFSRMNKPSRGEAYIHVTGTCMPEGKPEYNLKLVKKDRNDVVSIKEGVTEVFESMQGEWKSITGQNNSSRSQILKRDLDPKLYPGVTDILRTQNTRARMQ